MTCGIGERVEDGDAKFLKKLWEESVKEVGEDTGDVEEHQNINKIYTQETPQDEYEEL